MGASRGGGWDWDEAFVTCSVLLGAAIMLAGCVVALGAGLDEDAAQSLIGGLIRLGGLNAFCLGALLLVLAAILNRLRRK